MLTYQYNIMSVIWREATPYFVGQFFIEFLCDRFVELPLEVPWRNPHSIDHLNQNKHPAEHSDKLTL